jgi:hypothetical protein
MATALTPKYEQFRKRLELRNEPSQFHGLIAMRGIIRGHFDPPRPTGEEFDERFFAGELGGGLGLKVSARDYDSERLRTSLKLPRPHGRAPARDRHHKVFLGELRQHGFPLKPPEEDARCSAAWFHRCGGATVSL